MNISAELKTKLVSSLLDEGIMTKNYDIVKYASAQVSYVPHPLDVLDLALEHFDAELLSQAFESARDPWVYTQMIVRTLKHPHFPKMKSRITYSDEIFSFVLSDTPAICGHCQIAQKIITNQHIPQEEWFHLASEYLIYLFTLIKPLKFAQKPYVEVAKRVLHSTRTSPHVLAWSRWLTQHTIHNQKAVTLLSEYKLIDPTTVWLEYADNQTRWPKDIKYADISLIIDSMLPQVEDVLARFRQPIVPQSIHSLPANYIISQESANVRSFLLQWAQEDVINDVVSQYPQFLSPQIAQSILHNRSGFYTWSKWLQLFPTMKWPILNRWGGGLESFEAQVIAPFPDHMGHYLVVPTFYWRSEKVLTLIISQLHLYQFISGIANVYKQTSHFTFCQFACQLWKEKFPKDAKKLDLNLQELGAVELVL